jgi:hypothetical protein
MKNEVTVTDSQIAAKSIGEIVMYQPEGEVRLEVRVENETVWLNRQQLAILFKRDVKTIGKHITNALNEELKDLATVANFATVQKEGTRSVSRMVEHYNLDMVLSIGYRVKSANGIKFRRWANQVIKDYMLKGFAVNQRMIATEMQIANQFHEQQRLIENQGAAITDVKKSITEQNSRLSAVEQRIDFFVNATQAPTGGILATGTRFDGLVLITDLVKLAKRTVVFIDPFATIEVLKFAAARTKGVQAIIYSAHITPEFKSAVALHKKQYPSLDLKTMRMIHDRFLLVDDKVYHFGASFKDMGNEMTAFSILDFVTPAEVIMKIQESMKER